MLDGCHPASFLGWLYMSRVVFLGTGTSHGVPMIGCECPVCNSGDPKNNRTRTSLLIEYHEYRILIDAGIDLRQQALRENLHRMDAILFTHTHVDHVFGLDEIRRFNFLGTPTMPVYASADSIKDIRRIYSYIFNSPKVHGGIPSIDLTEIETQPFDVCGLQIHPIPIWHGNKKILGFRFQNVAYLTDCNGIPDESLEYLQNLDLLILDALRPKPHPTHFCLEESCQWAERLKAKQTLFVHMTHNLDHQTTNEMLPPHIQLAYDGQKVDFDSSPVSINLSSS